MNFILKLGKKIRKILKKIKKWALDSKLNLSVLSCAFVIFTLGIAICLIVIFRGGVDNTIVIDATTVDYESTEANTDETTLVAPADDEKFTTEVDITDVSNMVNNPSKFSIKLTVKDSGTKNGKFYTEYSLKIKNISDKTIDGWVIILRNGQTFELSDNWNAQYYSKNSDLVIMPYPDNERIVAGQEFNIGFVVTSYNYLYFKSATVFAGKYNESFNVTVNKYASEGTFTQEESTSDDETVDSETTTVNKTTEEDTTVENLDDETTTEQKTTSQDETTTEQKTTSQDETTTEQKTTSQDETTTEQETTSQEETA